jgi:hypothetical protein
MDVCNPEGFAPPSSIVQGRILYSTRYGTMYLPIFVKRRFHLLDHSPFTVIVNRFRSNDFHRRDDHPLTHQASPLMTMGRPERYGRSISVSP